MIGFGVYFHTNDSPKPPNSNINQHIQTTLLLLRSLKTFFIFAVCCFEIDVYVFLPLNILNLKSPVQPSKNSSWSVVCVRCDVWKMIKRPTKHQRWDPDWSTKQTKARRGEKTFWHLFGAEERQLGAGRIFPSTCLVNHQRGVCRGEGMMGFSLGCLDHVSPTAIQGSFQKKS